MGSQASKYFDMIDVNHDQSLSLEELLAAKSQINDDIDEKVYIFLFNKFKNQNDALDKQKFKAFLIKIEQMKELNDAEIVFNAICVQQKQSTCSSNAESYVSKLDIIDAFKYINKSVTFYILQNRLNNEFTNTDYIDAENFINFYNSLQISIQEEAIMAWKLLAKDENITTISTENMTSMVKLLLPGNSQKELAILIKGADLDQNQIIDIPEFIELYEAIKSVVNIDETNIGLVIYYYLEKRNRQVTVHEIEAFFNLSLTLDPIIYRLLCEGVDRVSSDEFLSIYTRIQRIETTSEFYQQAFFAIDSNNDGILSLNEIVIAYNTIVLNLDVHILKVIMHHLGEQVVDLRVFRTLFDLLKPFHGVATGDADMVFAIVGGGKQEIDFTGIQRAFAVYDHIDAKILHTIFLSADENIDGSIQKFEFADFYSRFEKVLFADQLELNELIISAAVDDASSADLKQFQIICAKLLENVHEPATYGLFALLSENGTVPIQKLKDFVKLYQGDGYKELSKFAATSVYKLILKNANSKRLMFLKWSHAFAFVEHFVPHLDNRVMKALMRLCNYKEGTEGQGKDIDEYDFNKLYQRTLKLHLATDKTIKAQLFLLVETQGQAHINDIQNFLLIYNKIFDTSGAHHLYGQNVNREQFNQILMKYDVVK